MLIHSRLAWSGWSYAQVVQEERVSSPSQKACRTLLPPAVGCRRNRGPRRCGHCRRFALPTTTSSNSLCGAPARWRRGAPRAGVEHRYRYQRKLLPDERWWQLRIGGDRDTAARLCTKRRGVGRRPLVEALHVVCRWAGYRPEPILAWLQKTHQRKGAVAGGAATTLSAAAPVNRHRKLHHALHFKNC